MRLEFPNVPENIFKTGTDRSCISTCFCFGILVGIILFNPEGGTASALIKLALMKDFLFCIPPCIPCPRF